MDWEERRAIEDKLNSLCITVEGGFRDVKKDVQYLGRSYVPLVLVSLLALVLAVTALVVAMENRALIVSLSVPSVSKSYPTRQEYPPASGVP